MSSQNKDRSSQKSEGSESKVGGGSESKVGTKDSSTRSNSVTRNSAAHILRTLAKVVALIIPLVMVSIGVWGMITRQTPDFWGSFFIALGTIQGTHNGLSALKNWSTSKYYHAEMDDEHRGA